MKQNNGITLIEMILAVALLSVVVSLGYMFYFTGFKAFERNVERVDFQQNVRHSLSFITKRLQNASDAGVTVPSSTEIHIRNEQDGKIEAFRLTGTTLRVNNDHLNPLSPFNPLAEGITSFEVTRDGRMITVTISAGNAQQDNLFTLSAQVMLRR